jgi:hypothetical protein
MSGVDSAEPPGSGGAGFAGAGAGESGVDSAEPPGSGGAGFAGAGAGSDLTPDDVREILRLVDESSFDHLELETPRYSIRFRRHTAPDEPSDTVLLGSGQLAPAGGIVGVTAPMVGTFYRAASPSAPPYVEVGSEVDADTQVCILEVMKLMNSVVAGVRGTVAEVCVENGAPVQFGDVLFRIRPA